MAGDTVRLMVGESVRIRCSPRDLMAAIDIVKKSGAYVPGMSLAQCVSFAFRISMEALRLAGDVPTREGFEYSAMRAGFPDAKNIKNTRARGLGITRVMEDAFAAGARAPSIRQDTRAQATDSQMRRWKELEQKAQVDAINISAEDAQELCTLRELCDPDFYQ